jgi:hypothetical protein
MAQGFFGPTASWLLEDGDESVFSLVVRRVADQLAARLRQRLLVLECENLEIDPILAELHRQMAELVAEGYLAEAGAMAETVTELVETYKARHRL